MYKKEWDHFDLSLDKSIRTIQLMVWSELAQNAPKIVLFPNNVEGKKKHFVEENHAEIRIFPVKSRYGL